MNTAERVLFGSFLLLLVWLPIPLGSNIPWAWSIAEFWIGLLSLAILLLYRTRLPWHYIAKYQWLLLPVGAFQVWVYLQSAIVPSPIIEWLSPNAHAVYELAEVELRSLSLDRTATQLSLFKGISYWLFLFNCIVLIHSGYRLKATVTALVISGTLQAFYGALMVLLNSQQSWVFGYPEAEVATASFVYKNHLANYLMMGLTLGLGLIITQLHISQSGSWFVRIRRWLQGMLSPKMLIRLALIIMVIALVMTRSRMGNSAFFMATTLGGFIALALYKNRPRALTALVVSVLIVDTLIVGTLFGLDKVQTRLMETAVSAESRDQVLLWSLNIVRDYPITGTGMASFYAVFPSYTQDYVGFNDFAHNDYIQFLVEAGVPATIMLGGMVSYAFRVSLHTVRTRQSRTMKGLALGSAMAILGMLIHITVDFNLQPMANAATFLFVLFVGISTSVLPAHDKKAFIMPFANPSPPVTSSHYV
jgi:O-antigen ligase